MNEFLIIIVIIGFTVMVFLSFFAGKALGRRHMFDVMQHVVEDEKKKALDKSRHILKGQFNEHLSPFMEDFPVRASECRFMGAPIDFICFKGLDQKNVEEIIFIEVKSGKANMNQTEKSIKQAVLNKKVSFVEYRIKDKDE
jgi:predicted Holliday junction resolvase-like endonuclease